VLSQRTHVHQEIRDAIRALCADFPDEYFRKVDEQRAYPEAFVDALTKAGWMAALIPQEYGGSGLGLVEASVIMEENQGVQFPIAEAFIEVEAANLMRYKACELFDAHEPCGTEANMAKHLAAKASWEAANVCLQTHGGFGFACEYDIERKFRETRLYQVAPISTNLIFSYVAEHVLGLPRSF